MFLEDSPHLLGGHPPPSPPPPSALSLAATVDAQHGKERQRCGSGAAGGRVHLGLCRGCLNRRPARLLRPPAVRAHQGGSATKRALAAAPPARMHHRQWNSRPAPADRRLLLLLLMPPPQPVFLVFSAVSAAAAAICCPAAAAATCCSCCCANLPAPRKSPAGWPPSVRPLPAAGRRRTARGVAHQPCRLQHRQH